MSSPRDSQSAKRSTAVVAAIGGAAAAEPLPSRAPQAGTADALASLNARLKSLSGGGNADYRPTRVKIADAQGVIERAIAGYESDLAPPSDILRRTFGYLFEGRTAVHPDSIAYIFDSFSIGPITICKAWKIIEHPAQRVPEIGAVGGSAGIGGGVVTSANSPVVRHDSGGRAEASIVEFPCTSRSYTAVAPGSITTPLPRHNDLESVPGPNPSSSSSPPASLAP